MQVTRLKSIGVLVLLLTAIAGHFIYNSFGRLPDEITIAGGPPGGQYQLIANALKTEIERRSSVRVKVLESEGSLENIRRLRDGTADIAMYQPETEELGEPDTQTGKYRPAFVANVYSEIVHFIVRRGAGIQSPADLRGKRVSLGLPHSGDYSASRLILSHFGMPVESVAELVQVEEVAYQELPDAFADGRIDAAFVTAGTNAPVITQLIETDSCEILPIPFSEAIASRHIFLSPYTVPPGLYRGGANPVPAVSLQTLATRAQLLTRTDASTTVIEDLLRLLMRERFLRKNGLEELFSQGVAFARRKPEFDIHPGAQNFYSPELRPVLNPDFVEAMEGMRSFIVSILIAGFLFFRWVKEQQLRKQEHRLDQHIRKLLEIERRQLPLDEKPGVNDTQKLQELLDQLTRLRQDALHEISAHELNSDRAAGCFIEMCHALSDKINAKLLRQRLDLQSAEMDKRLSELTAQNADVRSG